MAIHSLSIDSLLENQRAFKRVKYSATAAKSIELKESICCTSKILTKGADSTPLIPSSQQAAAILHVKIVHALFEAWSDLASPCWHCVTHENRVLPWWRLLTRQWLDIAFRQFPERANATSWDCSSVSSCSRSTWQVKYRTGNSYHALFWSKIYSPLLTIMNMGKCFQVGHTLANYL